MTTKECTQCHITKPLDMFYKVSIRKDRRRCQCIECCTKYRRANNERANKLQAKSRASNPERIIRRDILSQRKYSAKKKGMDYNLTDEWRDDKLSTGKCEKTGIPFVYEFHSPYVPSIDRIDSSKGYTTDNCQMVITVYNTAKNVYTDDLMLEMSKALIKESNNDK